MSAIEQISLDRNVDIHVAREHFKTNLEDAQTKESSEVVYNAIAADLRKALNFVQFFCMASSRFSCFSSFFSSFSLIKPTWFPFSS